MLKGENGKVSKFQSNMSAYVIFIDYQILPYIILNKNPDAKVKRWKS